MGQSPGSSQLVGSVAEAKEIQVTDPSRVVALTQTTLSVEDTKEIIETLRTRFPKLISRNDICYATTNRQDAVSELAKKVDVVLVIGAQNSSNCNRLREVAEQMGVRAFLVDDASHIDPLWLKDVQTVGVTSGASTPETLVQEVVAWLNPNNVHSLDVVHENVTFTMPEKLRERNKWAIPRKASDLPH